MPRLVRRSFPVAAALAAACAVPALGGDLVNIHVDDDAAPGGDGSSWTLAFRHLSDAMDLAATQPPGTVSVLVAGGSYFPDRSAAAPAGTGDRSASVELPDGAALIGGHLGLAAMGGENPYDRDLALHPSIVDGEIGTVVPVDNALHVVTASGGGVIDGLVVQGGFADQAGASGEGGGMRITGAPAEPLVIRHCTIRDNFGNRGGGVALSGSNAVIEDCTILANDGSGVRSQGGTPTVRSCTFADNLGSPDGGGLYIESGDATVESSIFTGNFGDAGGGLLVVTGGGSVTACTFEGNVGVGGALALSQCTTAISDCDFNLNESASVAGAMYLFDSETTIADCRFEENVAVVNAGAVMVDTSVIEFDACVFRLNSGDLGQGGAVYLFGSTVLVSASEFRSNFAGVDGGGLFALSPGLSVMDSFFCANTPTHIAGPAELLGGNEFLTACPIECPADVDGDGVVAVGDLLAVLAAWGPCAGCAEDIDGDGAVAVGDLLAVLAAWGDC